MLSLFLVVAAAPVAAFAILLLLVAVVVVVVVVDALPPPINIKNAQGRASGAGGGWSILQKSIDKRVG